MKQHGLLRVLLAAPCLFAGAAVLRAQVPGLDDPRLLIKVEETLDLERFDTIDLFVPEIPEDGGFDLVVPIDGSDYLLDLHPHSMRSPDFQVLEYNDDGTRSVVAPPPVSTYRGDVVDLESGVAVGRAAVSAIDGSITGKLVLEPALEVWGIQPLTDVLEAAPASDHVLYHSEDIIPHQGVCGTDAPFDGTQVPNTREFRADDIQPRSAGDAICEIVMDMDSEYYNWAGDNRRDVICNVEKLMNAVEDIYEDDVQITYEISRIILRRNNAQDPYNGTDPGNLLNLFCNEMDKPENAGWPRAVSHLLTGKNLDGSVIGIANLGGICFDTCGLSETNFTGNFVSRVGLTAHELGHNWSAGHCDGNADCWIMCSGLGGCSGNVSMFGPNSINSINFLKDTLDCLETEGSPVAVPIFEDFELANDLNDDLFTWVTGNVKNKTGAKNEVSGTRAMKLNATGPEKWEQDQARSNEIDLSGVGSATLSFWSEHRGGPEAGERLKVGYYGDEKVWTLLVDIESDGIDEDTFNFHSVAIPSNGLTSDFRFRFFMEADERNDKFFIDDLSLTATLLVQWIPNAGGDQVRPTQTASFEISSAEPSSPVLLYAGFEGLRREPFNPYKGMTLDLLGPTVLLGQVMSDARGSATVSVRTPADLPADMFFVQALALSGDEGENSMSSPPIKVSTRP